MDLSAVSNMVNTIWVTLQPYLPVLAGATAAEAGKQLPSAVGKMWDAVHARMAAKPAAKESLADLRETPGDADLQAAFRVQLKKLIEEDKGFHAELVSHLREAEPQGGIHIRQSGNGAVVVGSGNAVGPGGIIIEGNQNEVNLPKKEPAPRKNQA